jgi:DNA-binding transcriptional LysR family regulator
MKDQSLFDKIDLHLIRVLYTVLKEQSVSKAASRLGMHQPAVSAALRRLRDLVGDPLLVRSGNSMVTTEVGQRMLEPSGQLLRHAETMLAQAMGFDAATTTHTFSVAASDNLDPEFLPRLLARIKRLAPMASLEIHALNGHSDYREQLQSGQFDVVIANWLRPAEDLHRTLLFEDEIVCLVSEKHPAVRRGWTVEEWLACDHAAPTPMHPGASSVIDDLLSERGLVRNINTRCAYFGLIPPMVASSLLVLTSGRHFCERTLAQWRLVIVPCPVDLPLLQYHQLWHPRSHGALSSRWLRDQIKAVAAGLRTESLPAFGAAHV